MDVPRFYVLQSEFPRFGTRNRNFVMGRQGWVAGCRTLGASLLFLSFVNFEKRSRVKRWSLLMR